jgi:hypothetical protein
MARPASKLLIIAVAGAIVGAFCFFRASPQPLRVDFVGYTNQFRGLGREAVLALTNQSDAPLTVTFLPERKHPEWPTNKRFALNLGLSLPSHNATNFLVRLQPNEGVWRVRVLYRNPLITKSQAFVSDWRCSSEYGAGIAFPHSSSLIPRQF